MFSKFMYIWFHCAYLKVRCHYESLLKIHTTLHVRYLIQQQKFNFFYTHKHHATIIFFNKDYPNGYCEELCMVNMCLCIFPLTIWKEIICDIIISFAWRSTCLALACKLGLIYHYLLQCKFLLSFAFWN